MKHKILLVSMPFVDLSGTDVQKYLFDTRNIVNVPYGLLSICSYVLQYAKSDVGFRIININDKLATEYRNKHLVQDIPKYFEDFVEEEVKQYKPDIVGISMMFNIGYNSIDSITARIKQTAPEALVIVGGNLATVLHQDVAVKTNVDAVIYGEGEIPLLQLVESDDMLSYIGTSEAFVTKESLRAGIKPINSVVADLDTIPPIDFSHINLSNFNLPKQRGTVYKKEFEKEPVSRIIYTSRGCPYNCNFCAGFIVHGKKVRFLSIKRVVEDVKKMVEKNGLTELYICDDSFLFDKTRAKELLNEFVKMNIHVTFPALLMRNIDDEVSELLAKVGNTFQYTSMESGADYVLKQIIQKPLSKDEAKRAAKSLRKFGISVLTNIVVGFPEETDDHREETLETLYDIGFSWVFFMIALPVHGSRLYKQCKESGYIVNDNFFSPSLVKCNIRTPMYSPEHIEKQAYMMNLYTNFVHNYNLRTGNFDECIGSFGNVIKSYPEHAFAYYCLAKAHEGKGDRALALENKRRFDELMGNSAYWRDWAEYFDIR
jgi:anaerobic magnesium-protoporphyrin IX monomethyl ester cyclase